MHLDPFWKTAVANPGPSRGLAKVGHSIRLISAGFGMKKAWADKALLSIPIRSDKALLSIPPFLSQFTGV